MIFSPDKTLINGWLLQPSPFTAEIMAAGGLDSLTIDMQHGLMGFDTTVSMMQAMHGYGVIPIVRIPWQDPGIVMRLLDAGAKGIICPMINTADDARQFVSNCYYPPRGQRSFGPVRAGFCYGDDYPQSADSLVTPIVMIETRQALNNLDEILQIDGLGGVYIGPFDLSFALGCKPEPDNYEQPVMDAVDHILERCRHFGVPVGIHCISADYAAKMRSKGFNLVTAGCDTDFIKAGINNVFANI